MLVVVPGAGDVERAVTQLAQLGIGAYEARQQLLRGAPFALGVDVETARGAAIELRGAGVEAWAVDDETWEAAPPLVSVRTFRFSWETFEIGTRPTVHEPILQYTVKWADVQLVVPARSVQRTSTTITKTERKGIVLNPMKMLRPGKSTTEHVRDESSSSFVLVLARVPDVLFRFDHDELDYTGLGVERATVAHANYDALLQHLTKGASGARVDTRLEKIASKLSGATVAATTTFSGTARGKKTSRAYGADNEGAVVGAARLLCLAERMRLASR